MIKILFLAWFSLSVQAASQDAILKIQSGGQTKSFSTSELLKRKDVETLSIPLSDYSSEIFSVRAIRVAKLFDGFRLSDDAAIIFYCLDGFSAPLEKKTYFPEPDPKASVAYVAVEPPDKKWPPLPGKSVSAGPFYLVWKNAAFRYWAGRMALPACGP